MRARIWIQKLNQRLACASVVSNMPSNRKSSAVWNVFELTQRDGRRRTVNKIRENTLLAYSGGTGI